VLYVTHGGVLPTFALLVACASCGPYSNIGEKLDISVSVAEGDTYISASGTIVRILLLGHNEAGAPTKFTLSSFDFAKAAGSSATELQGDWSKGSAGTGGNSILLDGQVQYNFPDETSKGVMSRDGATRKDVSMPLHMTVLDQAGVRTLTGDAAAAGRYVLLSTALQRLDPSTANGAACAFHVAHVVMMSAETRILGFGSPRQQQYSTPATFNGVVNGTLKITLAGLLNSTTTLVFTHLADFAGAEVNGTNIIHANTSGDGSMSGSVSFTLHPGAGGGTSDVAGTIDFAASGDGLTIKGGNISGGHYHVAVQGGGSATVDPVAAPQPSFAICLGLP
jgi:hypothetical protein